MQNLRAVVRILVSLIVIWVHTRLRLNNIDASVAVYNTKVSHTAEIMRVLVIDLVDKSVVLSGIQKVLITGRRIVYAGVFCYMFTI